MFGSTDLAGSRGAAAECTLADGRRAIKAMLAAAESASTRRLVTVREARPDLAAPR